MQRYFLETAFDENGFAQIVGEDGKHIVKVMRMSEGNTVITVSEGEAFHASIVEMLPDGVVVKRQDHNELPSNELPIQVTIACGLPKGDKLDWIVQKGTELGMTSLLPFEAERSIVKWDEKKGSKKVERLRKIAKEAAEQCHRTVIPTIESPCTFKQLLANSKNYDVRLFADEEDAKSGKPHRIAEQLKNVYHKQSVCVLFGPEGGLSRKEAEALREAGFQPIALGPRILRAETAPLYVLSALSYEFE